MQEDQGQIAADDTAASVTESDAAATIIAGGDKPAADAKPKPAADAKPNGKAAEQGEKPNGKAKAGTIASGRDSEAEDADADADAKPYWPEDWREKMARRSSGDNDKAYQKELKRLQRFADPTGVYGTMRELDAKFDKGGLVKVPDKDAKPEEVAAFHKALGVPEKPEEYYANLQLSNGAVVGEADKPFVDDFAKHVHKTGMTPAQFKTTMDWYYEQQEKQAAELDERDERYLRDSTRELKDEWGPKYKGMVNSTKVLAKFHPRGQEGFDEFLTGRSGANQSINGNNPDLIRMFAAIAHDVNPNATVTEDGTGTPQTTEHKLAALKKLRQEDRRAFNKDPANEKEYLHLLEVRGMNQAKAR